MRPASPRSKRPLAPRLAGIASDGLILAGCTGIALAAGLVDLRLGLLAAGLLVLGLGIVVAPRGG